MHPDPGGSDRSGIARVYTLADRAYIPREQLRPRPRPYEPNADRWKENAMRTEHANLVDEIKQSMALLRRSL